MTIYWCYTKTVTTSLTLCDDNNGHFIIFVVGNIH